mmetsp:Transcript_456/g.729  ORF Transcript_456/g.729 Transcript_456/m.729 type:complete len:750 (-) Transcript_456:47-2296(-)|eukprot:CAMPEP_0119005686 /NCGR_PEP_ID=MMETSP1176-20130426/1865_1 /TAXON_ID=265551 /ORGANISM="Synedropsis recta cf, Strain CCMP1620" /LENGTH=749 /DNA_ID=CAMNT_0006957523 /DNA_START=70 /DNA_END=2319 /DNA_ORIENTATION=-
MRTAPCYKEIVLALLGLLIASSDAQGTELGQGIVTRVDVEQYADIALDIAELRSRLKAGDAESAMTLYREGKNSESAPNVKFTLQQMSTDLTKLTVANAKNPATPMYLYHVYGLADRAVSGPSVEDQKLYADNLAKSFISSSSETGADAVVALHSWMYATHVLYHGLHTCQLLSKADEPGLFQLNGGGMDEFIALWIGHDQDIASEKGHGLYALAQKAGGLFEKNIPEAQVNTNIKLLYNEGAAAVSLGCTGSKGEEETVPAMWAITQRIVTQMYIPLVQMLIDALYREDPNDSRLYALAIVPQIAQCRPSTYERLKGALLDGTVSVNRISEILADLQSAYDCLGFTCDDIGAYNTDEVAQCSGVAVNQPLAQYVPSTRVHAHSKIDLDILQLKILTSLQSYSFAKQLYMYGRNSAYHRETENDPYRVRSLQTMATSNARKAADPFYTEFVEYHNEPNYADKAVIAALERTDKWGTASAEQVTEVVTKTSAYQILYMDALSEIAEAVASCKKGNMLSGDGGAHQWDEVAAFLIGSLEGRSEGGSTDLQDGQLMWNLANKRAFQFQTVNKMGYSLINSELEDLLYAGRAESNAFDCANLEKSADRIRHLMLLPVIQSTIRYAIINQQLTAASTNADLAEGETFALSVLPIVKRYDENAAALIEENMIVRSGVTLVRSGPQEVANAFYAALDEFGYSCALVGSAPQADACFLEGGFANVKPNFDANKASSASRLSVISTLMGGFVMVCFWV